ncbi:LysR family transcriptional regulator [Sphingopyxis sp. 113P3]|uniref:LysR family transcriptional regulator n=1 Tax=Sphingopyxis sp. (strain 113P3) TaxID=292913 RepID=UPI0006BCB4C8|nr:LysR family transcriptional regulator [Sphingopyxis sp. 113P3]ALC11612.1 LysR family transcriptional regulator [Sphingopyxis sp. 113P3]
MAIGVESTTGLYAFVRAVEAGSFSAAARLAGTTPSAVSKSVERLEQRLGVKLFLRSTRSLTLTVDGTAYYERVAPLLRALDDAGDALSGVARARGLLRVSLPGVLGPTLVELITREFMPRHPEIRIEIDITDRHVDLVREGYDVAVRVGTVEDVDWMVRRIATLSLILVASPEWLDRVGHPATREEVGGLPHIRYRFGGRAYPIRFADGSELLPEGVLDTDSGQAMRIAALAGVGIAQLLRLTVADDLAAGRLVEVFPQDRLASVPVQALHAFGRLAPLRVHLFTDFLAGMLGPHSV